MALLELSNQHIISSVAGLNRWLAGRSKENLSNSARSLFGILQDINERVFDVRLRAKLLDTLADPVREICWELDTRHLGKPLPLTSQQRGWGMLAREFQFALGEGYAQVALDQLKPGNRVPLLRRRSVRGALHRAIGFLSFALVKSYLLYMPVPSGIWRQLHQLYVIARMNQLANPVNKAVLKDFEVMPTTIAELYMQAMLFAMASPYRLNQEDILTVYALCGHLASQSLILSPDQAPIDRSALFGFNPEEDHAPRHVAEDPDAGRQTLWFFDVSRPTSALAEPIEAASAGDERLVHLDVDAQEHTMSLQLGRHLFHAWSDRVVRRYRRLSVRHSLSAVVGMTYVHFKIGGDLDFQSLINRNLRKLGVGDGYQDALAQPQSVDRHPIVTRCRVLDQSLGGYRLQWPEGSRVRARVGGLLALSQRADAEQGEWLVAVFRWLRAQDDGSLEAGIELMGRKATAVVLNNTAGSAAGSPQRGLLIRGTNEDGTAFRHLLLPPTMTADTDALSVTLPTRDGLLEPVAIKLGQMVEKTATYCSYDYEPADVME